MLSHQQYAGTAKNNNNPINAASFDIAIHEEGLKRKQSDVISVRFYERETGVWEVHGEEDARLVAEILFRTGDLQTLNAHPNTIFITIPLPQAAAAMTELLQSQRIEAWTIGKGVVKHPRPLWSASPGNLAPFEKFLISNQDDCSASEAASDLAAPTIMAIYVRRASGCGCAVFIDQLRCRIGFIQFQGDCMVEDFEALLVQICPAEVLHPSGLPEVSQTLKLLSILGTEVEFSSSNSCPDYIHLDEDVSLTLQTLKNYLHIDCADYKVERHVLQQYMRIDETAIKALNLFPMYTQCSSSSSNLKKNSLFGILDSCVTKIGSRLLGHWIRQPLRDVDMINSRLDIVSLLLSDVGVTVHGRLRDLLRGVSDVSRIARRVLLLKGNLQDLVLLYDATCILSATNDALVSLDEAIMYDDQNTNKFSSLENSHLNTLETGSKKSLCILKDECKNICDSLAKYCALIEGCVDFSALDRHEYIVRADFDPALVEVKETKDILSQQIDEEFNRVATVCGLEAGKKLKLDRNTVYGYHFRISRLDGGKLNELETPATELAALKTGILFTTANLRKLSTQWNEESEKYASLQHKLVREMVAVGASYWKIFDSLASVLARIDVLQSFAHVSATYSYVRPLVYSENDYKSSLSAEDIIYSESSVAKKSNVTQQLMFLKESRHPCVEAANENKSFIPNDVTFLKDGPRLQLITGPNMGGKSTYIRQAAIIVLMAQIGSFVPCSKAIIPVRDAILVRVGAGDSIRRGLSTFMMEMVESATILRVATSSSLTIIDELGRGTSTSEGLGIAWGVCRRLVDLGCLAFFATHYHELTELALDVPGRIGNLYAHASVFSEDSLRGENPHDLQGTEKLSIKSKFNNTKENESKDEDLAKKNSFSKANTALDTVTMTYEIRQGVCSDSFGLQVAQMAGFPKGAMEMARVYYAEFSKLDESLLSEIEAVLDNLEAESPVSSVPRPAILDLLCPSIFS